MDEHTQITLPPFVECELVYETGFPGMKTGRWRSFEVWTRNRIYSCDWTMTCIEVIERASGENVPNHSLLGARLSGGQTRTETGIEVTYPAPRPGSEAVFDRGSGRGYVSTSTVERVVLRLRVLTVEHQKHLGSTWDDLTSSNLVVKKP